MPKVGYGCPRQFIVLARQAPPKCPLAHPSHPWARAGKLPGAGFLRGGFLEQAPTPAERKQLDMILEPGASKPQAPSAGSRNVGVQDEAVKMDDGVG